MRALLVGMVAGALASLAGPARAGELGDLRSETQGSGGSSDSSGSTGTAGSGGSGEWAAAIGEAMVEAYREEVRRLYARYPYADGARGFVLKVDPEDDAPPGQRFAGSFTLDGAALGPTVGRAGVDVELMVRRFGLAFDLAPHLELRPLDALSLGSAGLLVGVVLLPRWQVYGGLGTNVMIDGRVRAPEERVDAVGVNGTLRTTLLLARPVVLRGRMDVGWLGVAPAVLGRVTAGVLVRRVELFGGYEGRRVGDVVLHGPTVGARVWF
jgi:hypothetical protein